MTKKKKVKMRPNKWDCNTWSVTFYFFIGWKVDDFRNFCKKEFKKDMAVGDGWVGSSHSFTHNEKSHNCLWVKDKNDLSTLLHEAVHASNWTLSQRGWVHDADNDEPSAYLTGAIFEKALEGFKINVSKMDKKKNRNSSRVRA